MQTFLVATRFALINVLCIAFIAGMVAGNGWIWAAFLFSLLGMGALDETIGDDAAKLPGAARLFYEFNLYSSLPILITMTFVALHHFIGTDPVGMIHSLSLIGIEFKSARSHHQDAAIAATVIGIAYFYGLMGVTVGHELTHRTTNRIAMTVGRALLAFAFNTQFSIAHVYGHHRNVTTYDDPGSARRGEYVLWYAVRSMISTVIEALRIEAARLHARGMSAWSWQNRFVTGQLYSIAIIGAVALIGGGPAALGVAGTCVLAQVFDKTLEYVQHYGLVRVPGTPIEARHSWDTGRLISNTLHYNLGRHADHHLAGGKPFWDLELKAGAPVLPFGYPTAALVALIPPLWHRMIDPLLVAWDQQMASEGERSLIRKLGWELPRPASRTRLTATD